VRRGGERGRWLEEGVQREPATSRGRRLGPALDWRHPTHKAQPDEVWLERSEPLAQTERGALHALGLMAREQRLHCAEHTLRLSSHRTVHDAERGQAIACRDQLLL
jgi:hypothetical protein